ncbi:amino acid ABC transporter permease [Piscinibacter gummiphilus]|uniref:Glutamate ABC transporter permease n=1 Tax=Piscinibacter gummiphilus TaxID=946333 RepID=A0A1W6L5S9_9BURK|nr:amino acid ABC transporter permease [Piscinibacter gummiphilus]ARN19488.1 glutamate ABC transporter permease [Piscinibacter gummiphilus]ATU64158.1 amino acid ABC transporter permease [Piscinibacter gummiphilus]GLS92869.1 glutamate/aspartate ABC transporter permease [Piscinibacter gummiphilus]
MSSNWDWQVFCKSTIEDTVYPTCFGPGGDTTYFEWLLSAWGWTLSVAALGWIVALVFGSLMGIARTTPSKPLVWLGNVWSEVFRNIPLLVQIFLWYHVLPQLFVSLRSIPSFLLVAFALGFFTSARVAEQVRAGIMAIPKGQRYAGLAMGFSQWQTYRYVLLPRAFRIVIPPLTSEAMSIIKNSSVAFAVGIAELTLFAMQSQEETSRGIEMYLAVTGLYFLSAFLVNRIALFIEHRAAVPGMVGAGQ